jgi:hypothetical protein
VRGKLLTVAGAIALALVLSGCGGGGGGSPKASPEKWVSTFCGSLGAWEQSVTVDASKFKTLVDGLQSSGSLDLVKVRTKFVLFLDRLIASTEKVQSDIGAVGAPDVANGDKIQTTVTGALSKLISDLEKAKTKAEALPATDPLAFAARAGTLGNEIEASAASVGTALSGLSAYNTPEFSAAAKADPACQKIGG